MKGGGLGQTARAEVGAGVHEFWLGILARFDIETAWQTLDRDIAAIKPRKSACASAMRTFGLQPRLASR
jgi:hypothetical protein